MWNEYEVIEKDKPVRTCKKEGKRMANNLEITLEASELSYNNIMTQVGATGTTHC